MYDGKYTMTFLSKHKLFSFFESVFETNDDITNQVNRININGRIDPIVTRFDLIFSLNPQMNKITGSVVL